MHKTNPSQQTVALYIFLFYCLPILALCAYSMEGMPSGHSWKLVGGSIMVCSTGSLILFFFFTYWKEQLEHSTQHEMEKIRTLNPPSLTPKEEKSFEKPEMPAAMIDNSAFLEELQQKEMQLQLLHQEKSQLAYREEKLKYEISLNQEKLEESLSKKEKLQSDYLHAISEQRKIMEQQEQHILQLEGNIRDLKYEIKTLLQVSETQHEPFVAVPTGEKIPAPLYTPQHSQQLPRPTSPFNERNIVPPTIEADLQLKRCLDIAQKITTSSPFNSENSRYRDFSTNSYAIDLRRLLDSLRSENSSTIMLYSQKEDKLLFANNQAKTLLGWSPEKFVQDFPHLIHNSMTDWKHGIAQLTTKHEIQLRLMMKTKSGHDTAVKCHLGIIPTGIFRNHIIGVLYTE